MKRDPLVEIELDIHGDAAAARGQAGTRLREAIAALKRTRDRRGVEEEEKKKFAYAAGEALWAYIVQREAMGLTDHDPINDVYGVTSDVWSWATGVLEPGRPARLSTPGFGRWNQIRSPALSSAAGAGRPGD